MKKIFLSSLVITSICAFAYTQTDVDNANFLAEKNIITPQTTTAGYRLDDTITRAEVVGIALKIKGISLPSSYQCKKYFTDVIKNDWICRAVEIGADYKLVSRENKTFRPQDKITRVEALAVIMQAYGLSTKQEGGTPENKITIDSSITWQQEVLVSAYNKGIIYPKEVLDMVNGDGEFVGPFMKFYPNQNAKRGEVFEFVKNAFPFQIDVIYTISLDSACQINEGQGLINSSWSREDMVPSLYPLPMKYTFSNNYMVKNGTITYIAQKMNEMERILGSYIYQYDCSQNTSTQITQSINSGLYAGTSIEDVDETYILVKIHNGEFQLPGGSKFYIHNLNTQKGIFIKSNTVIGIEKYEKLPKTRYMTSVEKLRINNGIIEAKVTINDAGENADPTSLPEYSLISEKWIQLNPETGTLY